VQSNEYRQFLEKAGNIPASDSPEQFGQVIADTVKDAAPYVHEFHMKIQ
jgi:hypothetical protein